MNRKIFIFIILGLALSGCGTTPISKADGPRPGKKEILLGIFEGKLPCADCPGIQTRLTLTQEGKFIDIGHFTLKETYLERSVKPLETKGEWTVIKGTLQDDNAVVYELTPDNSKQLRYFLKTDDTGVKQLDKDGNEIDSKLDFTLKKVK